MCCGVVGIYVKDAFPALQIEREIVDEGEVVLLEGFGTFVNGGVANDTCKFGHEVELAHNGEDSGIKGLLAGRFGSTGFAGGQR